ncbi:MAG: VWA domain-containing protein [Nitrospirae bacterium]|nr:VWA domain-containing protein [Nitrospirota bacterium]
MKINRKAICIFIIAGIMAMTYDNAYSEASNNIDVVLVMDSSGSMKKTDPHSLRIPAAKLFISLLGDNDRAGVISFSDKSYPIIDLTAVGSKENKDNLFKAADRISSNGLYTNLHDALSKGLSVLADNKKADRNRFIVLMSDGMMDVGDPDEDIKLLDKIKNELTIKLEEEKIKVYAIAFTEQSDKQLLEKISKRTGGFYNLALTDKDFHLIFTSIFESLKSPDMLPMNENGFLIDGSIEEVTIVATKGSPKTQIQLSAPGGQRYSNKDKSTGIGWFASDNFDMITIQKPAEGRWELLFSIGENNKAYIITNLKLQTNFDQLYSTFGDPLDIKIWLEKDGAPITEQAVLDKFNIYLEMTGPDGTTSKLTPFSKGEGIYIRNVAPFAPGNYKLRIMAQGKTFERERAFVFNVADVKESKEDILSKREKEKKVHQQGGHKTDVKNKTDKMSWAKIIIQFICINLVISIIGLVYWKRKSINKIKVPKNLTKIKGLIKREKEVETGKVEEKEQKDIKTEAQTKEDQDVPVVKEKQDEQEEQKQEIALEEKEIQTGQGEYDELKQEISLDGNEQAEKELLEIEKTNRQDIEKNINIQAETQEVETEEREQQSNNEKDKEPDLKNDNQEVNADGNKPILNQEDLDQLLASANEMEEKTEVEESEQITDVTLDGESRTQQVGEEPEKQDEQQANLDDIWQEALQEQKAAEDGEGRTQRVGEDPEKQDEQQENLDDIWQEALQEQKAAGDVKEDSEKQAKGKETAEPPAEVETDVNLKEGTSGD